MQKAKKETGLQIAIEVATAAHVKLALEHDIDILWIGARITVNPFAVQEIADALQNTDKIVLVKNPVNPDLALWIGGVERLYNANIKNIGVIHRGFSTYEKTKYRNNPEWQIAIDFQNKFPDIPLLIDPSHITGNRDMIFQVTQEALDLKYDGMIIETHIDPDNAWSDAAQQVTPTQLKKIIFDLTKRSGATKAAPAQANRDVQIDIGQQVQVEAWQDGGTARVSYRGASWQVRFAGHGTPAPGTHVIFAVDGNQLRVAAAAT